MTEADSASARSDSTFDNSGFENTALDDSVMRRVGNSDLKVFPIALGAAIFGWTLPGGRATEMLDRFVALGGNLIDTADSYSSGLSEQIIGTWMRDRGNRDRVVIATKVGRHPDFAGLSSETVHDAVHESLTRLQTDYIDLLYFHADDETVPLDDSLTAVSDLISAGKVRYLGLSNYTAQRLLEARMLAGSGLPRVDALALEYSLIRRDIVEGDVAEMIAAQNISLMPYFVLANGFLGRHRDLKNFKPDDTRLRRAATHNSRRAHHILRALDDIALGHGVDIAVIAAAWALGRPNVAAAALGADELSDLEALMHAAQIRLTRSELASLEKL